MVKDKYQTKEKILEASIDLFSRQGFSSVSVRDITRSIGLKESSLYYHFKNKEDILDSIFTLFQTEFSKVFPPITSLKHILANTTPEDFLKQGLTNFKLHIADHPITSKITRILSIEQFSHPKARSIIVNDMYHKSIDFLEIAFREFIELGLISNFSPRLLAAEYQYPIFAMLTEYQILKFDNKDTTSLDRQLHEHITFFLSKVQTGKRLHQEGEQV